MTELNEIEMTKNLSQRIAKLEKELARGDEEFGEIEHVALIFENATPTEASVVVSESPSNLRYVKETISTESFPYTFPVSVYSSTIEDVINIDSGSPALTNGAIAGFGPTPVALKIH
jgi:hypothetical protein